MRLDLKSGGLLSWQLQGVHGHFHEGPFPWWLGTRQRGTRGFHGEPTRLTLPWYGLWRLAGEGSLVPSG